MAVLKNTCFFFVLHIEVDDGDSVLGPLARFGRAVAEEHNVNVVRNVLHAALVLVADDLPVLELLSE